MADPRKIPTGRLGRWARLAGAGARAGASLVLGRDDDAAALRAAELLGTLRGLAAKIGQMASYVDGLLPEEQRERYEAALGTLQDRAPASPPAVIRRMVEEELGAPLDRLFAAWEDAPFASASIGQVHRARLENGREVAVKVQHPGIAKALESDLAGAGVLEAALGLMGMRALGSGQMLEEVRARFREELDYSLEAARQRAFAVIHAGDPTIQIPEVIGERSTARVLTSEFVVGRSFAEATAADQAERAAYCATLWRFVYKGTIVGGVFNADPHPGNYLFGDDGRVTFLDFGCVQRAEPGRQERARELHRAAIGRDEQVFTRAAQAMLGTRGGVYERALLDYLRRAFRPQRDSPFRITREYVGDLVGTMKGLVLDARRARDGSVVELPPGVFFMNRLQFGFYSVLARLDAEVDYAAIERGFLDLPAQPPPP